MNRTLIGRPVAVTMFLIAVAVLGVVSLRKLPVSLVPDTDIPVITVRVSSPDRSARELYELMVSPLCSSLSQTSGLEDIGCTVRDGCGVISMTFDYGKSDDYLLIDVNERVDRAMGAWPQGEERPLVSRASVTDIPAFFINVSLKEDGGEQEFTQLGEFVRQVVSRRLEQLPEVAMVDISGVTGMQYSIEPDMRKMEAAGLSTSDLAMLIGQADINLGNISVSDGDRSFDVRFESVVTGPSDMEDIWVNVGGRALRTGDMARVSEKSQPVQGYVLSDGKRAVTLAVIKRSDARMDALKNSVSTLMDSFEDEYPDLQFTITRDQTELLDYSMDSMFKNLAIGALLACIVIFIFMNDLISSLLVTLTIPVSLLLAFIAFHIFGISLNVISLSGVLLGLGMTVDNSIVVIDNIGRHRLSGRPIENACVEGTCEVFAPMLSSVLTTCALFIPLIFISGIAGALFYDEAIAVTVTLFASFVVSVTVLPVYYHAFFRYRPYVHARRQILNRISRIYENTLVGLFRHRAVLWGTLSCLIVSAILVFQSIEKKKLPEMSHSDALLEIDWNDGLSAKENVNRCLEMTSVFEPRMKQCTVMAGVQQFALPHTAETSVSQAVIYLNAGSPSEMEWLEKSLELYINEHWPKASSVFRASGNVFDMLFSSKQPILEARLSAKATSELTPDLTDSLLSCISSVLPVMTERHPVRKKYIELVCNPEMSAMYGIGPNDLVHCLKERLGGNTVRRISRGSVMIPVRLDSGTEKLKGLTEGAVDLAGVSVPLSSVLTEVYRDELGTVTAGAAGEYYPVRLDVTQAGVPNTIKTVKQAVTDDGRAEVSFSGSYFKDREMVRQLFLVLAISLVLLFLILAAQFESLLQPLIIMSELIVDIAAVILTLKICRVSFNLMSMTGLTVMCGIVINDSILKVDTVNRLRKAGYGLKRSILRAGQMRLDAILMTSLTTILAIVPFLVRGDMGSDLQYPMSVALISGMTAGTLASIFVVPLVYFVIYNHKNH